ncbi:P-loop containing nucleoside triphosphate hydrolase protein [Phanerochaete sordida]|uniref:P-loop containing nucleoside triphosphate hydrolase protein n=1 Tax=Phanerochaete sordida TaxID=48140 RepID=A0A9P3GNA1_9APHY|nr:P-loop containing nucleoside triphosphate hydrolase protein [Phanerochaete sordida]
MDPLTLLQSALTGLVLAPQLNSTLPDVAQNGTASHAAAAVASPLSVPNLMSFLLSFSALREWLKLLVIGGLIETCRRLCMQSWTAFIESFWITACFEERDVSYTWLLFWLSKQPTWSRARCINVSTRSFGVNSPVVVLPGDENEAAGRKICYLPSFARTYTLWYQGRYVNVTRSEVTEGAYHTKETLEISIFARDHAVLNSLLMEAKKAYIAAEEHTISIYVSESSGSWRNVASRPKRPLRSIVLDPGVKDLLLDDARDFLNSKDWYAERGIPFRRGYLLYGAPGSGKTSMIHSLAGELGLDVYVVSLARVGLDDTGLGALLADLPERCIALMEDIDAAFTHGLTRDVDPASPSPSSPDGPSDTRKHSAPAPAAPVSRVTLSGLLNALDGVGAQEGRILYATTNRYGALDPALCRPGRMDLHVEFRLASRYQARELFKCFYVPAADAPDDDDDADEEKEEEKESDSAYGTRSTPSAPSSRASAAGDAPAPAPASPSPSPSASPEPNTLYAGARHRADGPRPSRRALLALADRFAAAIPEREFSMASLQGYLMSYKTRPAAAADAAPAWVAEECAARGEKGCSRQVEAAEAEA